MRKLLVSLLPVACAVLVLGAENGKVPPMPAELTGNAVASLRNGTEIFSIMGIGTKRTWDSITPKTYVLRFKSGKWSEGKPVPGVAGRLGASAIGVKSQIFVFGGYTVDGRGEESVVSDVNSYLPDQHRWYRAADIPVPVDRAVIGMVHDRYIYLIGGRSRKGPVNNVQVYDVEKNTWSQATPFPGPPVFGHAGGVADETIVYVDGAKMSANGQYNLSDECWMGKIDRKDPNKIQWSKLPAHPGPGRFGIVGGAAEKDHRVFFSGGSRTIFNFKGVDQDGQQPDISPVTFLFDLHGNQWETLAENTQDVRADVNGLAFSQLGPLVLGGTQKNAAITAAVLAFPKK